MIVHPKNITAEQIDKIVANGGGTLGLETLRDDNLPTDGYYVGEYNLAVQFAHEGTDNSVIVYMLDEIRIPEFYRMLPEGFYLGFWRSENGYWYIDISRHVSNRVVAENYARINYEKAIWDIANNVEIPIPQD